MYEENNRPLPPGNALQAFAPIIAEIKQTCELQATPALTHEQVLFWAKRDLQERLCRISRRLLLPGSGLRCIEKLERLIELSNQGVSCILCLNHRSNLDVPTLCTLLHDHSKADLFDKMIWIAGRKLQEDRGMTGLLVQAFNRVVVTPRTWSEATHSTEEVQQAHLINMAAHRIIHEYRHRGFVFALFPGGTRIRPGNASTTRAIPETDSYLKSFDYLLPGHIQGCTLPVSRDQDLTRETPRLDRVSFSFGEPMPTEAWRAEAARRYPDLTQRAASARAIMHDIDVLGSGTTETSRLKKRQLPATKFTSFPG